MIVFIAGTDTDVGKTLVASWICLHTGYDYFKPIQSGVGDDNKTDSQTVLELAKTKIHRESHLLRNFLSPHLAAEDDGKYIELSDISLPAKEKLIVEGAGGLLVPINDDYYVVDLIKYLNIPVILVARSKLGTINHTLLSLECLKQRQIDVLGVILSGVPNPRNKESIERYSKVEVLAELPYLDDLSLEVLKKHPLSPKLKQLLEV